MAIQHNQRSSKSQQPHLHAHYRSDQPEIGHQCRLLHLRSLSHNLSNSLCLVQSQTHLPDLLLDLVVSVYNVLHPENVLEVHPQALQLALRKRLAFFDRRNRLFLVVHSRIGGKFEQLGNGLSCRWQSVRLFFERGLYVFHFLEHVAVVGCGCRTV